MDEHPLLAADRTSGRAKNFFGLFIGVVDGVRTRDWALVERRRLRVRDVCAYCHEPVSIISSRTTAFADVPGWASTRAVPIVVIMVRRRIVNPYDGSLDVATESPPGYWHIECALAETIDMIVIDTDVKKLVAFDRLLDAHENWVWSTLLNVHADVNMARRVLMSLDELAAGSSLYGRWARVAAARIRERANMYSSDLPTNALRSRVLAAIAPATDYEGMAEEFREAIDADSSIDVYDVAALGGVVTDEIVRAAIVARAYEAATALVDVARSTVVSGELILFAEKEHAPDDFIDYLRDLLSGD